MASPGVACGRVAFDSESAKAMAAKGAPVILVRHDTSTEDVVRFGAPQAFLPQSVAARRMRRWWRANSEKFVLWDVVRSPSTKRAVMPRSPAIVWRRAIGSRLMAEKVRFSWAAVKSQSRDRNPNSPDSPDGRRVTRHRIYELYPDQYVEGEALLDGQNILAEGIDVNLVRARIGMLFQKPTPFPMPIYENIAFGIRIYERLSRETIDQRLEEALGRAALWDEVKDILPRSGLDLSIGQQQHLCLARTIATVRRSFF